VIRERLFGLIENAGEMMRERSPPAPRVQTAYQVIADRASSLLPSYVERGDVPRLVRLLAHPSECAQNNILYTLVDSVGSDHARRLAAEAVDSGQISSETQEFVREHVADPMMLWAYIPNLNQMVPAEQEKPPA
jgi:hypothetical protein